MYDCGNTHYSFIVTTVWHTYSSSGIYRLVGRFLEATVTALGEGQPPPVRISAVRAVYFFCDNLIANNQTALLIPALPTMYEGVMSIAQSYGTEVLGLSLDSMEHLLKVRPCVMMDPHLYIFYFSHTNHGSAIFYRVVLPISA